MKKGSSGLPTSKVRFDPSYQTLMLHSVSIRRGDRIIPKLSLAAVKVLQREKELDYLIFDGSKTAHIFLEDVRVGDVVSMPIQSRAITRYLVAAALASLTCSGMCPCTKCLPACCGPRAASSFSKI
ncbi:MAG: DUF3857 domain-containing protein [Rhodoferax sp.]|nr:DUF3857 domain-containing protein [Rhodoferax sp.]